MIFFKLNSAKTEHSNYKKKGARAMIRFKPSGKWLEQKTKDIEFFEDEKPLIGKKHNDYIANRLREEFFARISIVTAFAELLDVSFYEHSPRGVVSIDFDDGKEVIIVDVNSVCRKINITLTSNSHLLIDIFNQFDIKGFIKEVI